MLKVQVSIPELKSHALAIREMAMDPMTTLQTLAGDLRPRFEGWLLYVSESPIARSARGLILGALFTPDGVQIASTTQEGLIRIRR